MNDKDLDKQIKDLVEKGLSGDMAVVNSIEDRRLRGKVKAAIVKAKRASVSSPKVVENSKTPDVDDPITILVKEGLSGNMNNINSLEDRVFRAKVKSALMKAKKLAAVSTNSSNRAESSSEDSLNTNNPNVKIGDNAVVGANSVVIKDIEKNTINSGIPAIKIKNKMIV